MTTLKVFLVTLLLIHQTATTIASCVSKGQTCDEDCDCCGFGEVAGTKCEIRNLALGRRCYVSKNIGIPCDSNGDCKSQYCNKSTKLCAYKPWILEPPKHCPVTFSHALAVDGLHPSYPEECEGMCKVEGKAMDALYAIDGNVTTAYANQRALSSGLLLYPDQNAPALELELCSAPNCPMCDPKCYKLEGYCTDTNSYELVQEGDFEFDARGECLKFPILARSLHSHYKLTFPCQVAPAPICPTPTVSECTCATGLTPFNPPDKAPGTECNGEAPTLAGPRLEWMGNNVIRGKTEIVYRITNPGSARRSQYAFEYAILQWDNKCCHECYTAYFDIPGRGGDGAGELTPHDEPCSYQCQSNEDLQELMVTEDDPNLCMQGIKIINEEIVGRQTYFIKLVVEGTVNMIMGTVGIKMGGRSGGIAYERIFVPECGCKGEITYEGECLAYPMQIGEVGLGGKCNQLNLPLTG